MTLNTSRRFPSIYCSLACTSPSSICLNNFSFSSALSKGSFAVLTPHISTFPCAIRVYPPDFHYSFKIISVIKSFTDYPENIHNWNLIPYFTYNTIDSDSSIRTGTGYAFLRIKMQRRDQYAGLPEAGPDLGFRI